PRSSIGLLACSIFLFARCTSAIEVRGDSSRIFIRSLSIAANSAARFASAESTKVQSCYPMPEILLTPYHAPERNQRNLRTSAPQQRQPPLSTEYPSQSQC